MAYSKRYPDPAPPPPTIPLDKEVLQDIRAAGGDAALTFCRTGRGSTIEILIIRFRIGRRWVTETEFREDTRVFFERHAKYLYPEERESIAHLLTLPLSYPLVEHVREIARLLIRLVKEGRRSAV
jgi:hypothetical protein